MSFVQTELRNTSRDKEKLTQFSMENDGQCGKVSWQEAETAARVLQSADAHTVVDSGYLNLTVEFKNTSSWKLGDTQHLHHTVRVYFSSENNVYSRRCLRHSRENMIQTAGHHCGHPHNGHGIAVSGT